MCREDASIWPSAPAAVFNNVSRPLSSAARSRRPVTGVKGTEHCSLG